MEGLWRWKRELDRKVNTAGGSSIPTVILANKEDLRSAGKNSQEDLEMEELTRDLGVSSWTRTSAKTGKGVEEGIRSLVWQILDREQGSNREIERTGSVIQLPLDDQHKKISDCQCW